MNTNTLKSKLIKQYGEEIATNFCRLIKEMNNLDIEIDQMSNNTNEMISRLRMSSRTETLFGDEDNQLNDNIVMEISASLEFMDWLEEQTILKERNDLDSYRKKLLNKLQGAFDNEDLKELQDTITLLDKFEKNRAQENERLAKANKDSKGNSGGLIIVEELPGIVKLLKETDDIKK